MIESPMRDQGSLKSMYHQALKTLLAACESRIPRLFWLDLTAMLRSPGTTDRETSQDFATNGSLCKTTSGMKGYFSDGTPFADLQTKKWLADAMAQGTPPPRSETTLRARLENDTGKAQAMADAGNLSTAIAQLRGRPGEGAVVRSASCARHGSAGFACKTPSPAGHARISASSSGSSTPTAWETGNLRWPPRLTRLYLQGSPAGTARTGMNWAPTYSVG